MLFINKLFNSIACLLSFTNLQLVIPGRTWILLYLGRTVYKRLWACLALYLPQTSFAGGNNKAHENEFLYNVLKCKVSFLSLRQMSVGSVCASNNRTFVVTQNKFHTYIDMDTKYKWTFLPF